EEQIETETKIFIEFLSEIYAELGFTNWAIKLSTRPEKRIGSDAIWDQLETALGNACKAAGYEYDIQEGEGAFYGPKLEFVLTDAIGRDWQCGTLQVDSNMPERLDASYVGQDGNKHQPFMLHRATLGSFERFIGILIEEHAGKLPFWLAPRQVVVASIISDADDYVHEVVAALNASGVRAEADVRNEKINYKVREHSVGKVPVILAVGAREVEERTVTVRRLGEKQTSVQAFDDVKAALAVESTPPDLR
ncbi:His/Gly/Thr/Pro-type tRNA ligase C-terminal domain-containing protein, partial [Ascidiaceihabitans sp.]|nr:His/Gly/Thr/Pro-type tRNA ligase C-terminal domain-containing protein [Ascidiaceihabitans sp.]